jgi:hypothetical protein
VNQGDIPAASVWYASEKHVFAVWKFRWYDDKGSLDITPTGLRFFGQKDTINLGQSLATAIIVLIVPWYAIVSMALGDLAVLLAARAGVFRYLTFDNPLHYLLLGILNVLAFSAWPKSWVRVEYEGEGKQKNRAYFTDASILGRWSGGVKRLQERFHRSVETK